jgi:NDP-sugar pyrophosphorylase family protein
MRAMILAAGKGTRLRPLTETIPKPLVDVCGRPMIAFALELLREAGIRDVVINLHHLGHLIRAALGDGSQYGVRINYSEEDPILDTGGGIEAARRFLHDGTFVIVNADVAIDLRLRDVIDFHRRHGAVATLVLRADPQAERKDDIGIDAAQRIRRFLGQPYDGVSPCIGERYFFGSVHVVEPRLFDYMQPGVYSITRDVYPRLLAAGEPILGYVHQGYWRVLDTPGDLAAGRRELADWRHQPYS